MWLPAISNLNCGVNSKKSIRINRAAILSPPVSAFILLSAQRRPSSVSTAVTNLAPWSPARSVGWRSCDDAVKVSIGGGAVIVAEDTGNRVDEDALSVGAGAVEKKQSVCRCEAGEGVAGDTLQKGDQLVVAVGHAMKEGEPGRTLTLRRRGGDLRRICDRIVRPAPSRS